MSGSTVCDLLVGVPGDILDAETTGDEEDVKDGGGRGDKEERGEWMRPSRPPCAAAAADSDKDRFLGEFVKEEAPPLLFGECARERLLLCRRFERGDVRSRPGGSLLRVELL